ncbi:olfactory receptor 5I1-like isoform X2 [Crotalus tigris]|uniref:olfactory receptor 5I1-like isoform X2 n=1 Tax=Crotalus tigris TaxID=88082 RepID=UPI00192F4870|nr:olfactory receptor 5I1-like isoform X2 [Crotalus tigris]
MAQWNQTTVSEFILVGFTDNPVVCTSLFVVFLAIYVITLLGNLGMIALIRLDSNLQTPMYFFLSNLSFSDICYSTVIVPQTLVNFLAEKKSISFIGCAAQFYFYAVFASVECLLLAAMAYDRYVAICNPLLYPTVMSKKDYVHSSPSLSLISTLSLLSKESTQAGEGRRPSLPVAPI